MLDYYAILDVPVDATAQSIRKAYRLKAQRHHPDHGGSHKEMLLINEAVGVLSDPVLRQKYDYARAHMTDPAAQRAAAAASARAKETASQYPREWTAFEAWLERLAADVAGAEYGQTGRVIFNMPLPTVQNSASGGVMLLVGAILGGVVSIWLLPTGPWISYPYAVYVGRFIIGAVFGSWVGRTLHAWIKKAL